MAYGDDKKKNLPAGQHSGHTGYVDNLGGEEYYDQEVDEGGGVYSVSGNKPYSKKWKGPITSDYPQGMPYDVWIKQPGNRAKEKKFVESRKDKQTHTQKAQANVTNTKNNNSNNGNAGGDQNQSQSQSITNDVKVDGKGTNNNNSSSSSSSSSDDGFRFWDPKWTKSPNGYTGNNPRNGQWQKQNVTNNINISGLGGGKGPGGGGSGGGGGANPGKTISDMLGRGPKQNPFKKTTGITQTNQGGATPYKFRGLQNQFESWQMNHYNNDTTT